MRWLFLPLLATLLAAGCSHYEYDIVRPPEFTGHIGKEDKIVQLAPLEYRFNAIENYLVVRIYNTTNDPIDLLGSRSTAVDASGQGHPIRGQSIVPASFVKIILPQPPPTVEPRGPVWTFGVGVSSVRNPEPVDPVYFDEITDDFSWEWNGESDVRLILQFHRGNEDFTHEFTFHRKKM